MRIRIAYATTYRYARPTRSLLQVLRLTPRSSACQQVVRWRLETDADARLRAGEDALGNLTHTLYVNDPVETLTVGVTGEVETADAHGVVVGAVERFPPAVYLRETALTRPNADLGAFAQDVAAAAGDDVLTRLHALLETVHREVAFDTSATDSGSTAAESFALGRGVCQDLSHIFIAAARRLGVPARYVSGHLARSDGVTVQEAAHAWAEAYAPGLGWVGFDPANGVCPTDRHVRVAVGLDYLGAAPVRGSRVGGGAEELAVKLSVEDAHQIQA